MAESTHSKRAASRREALAAMVTGAAAEVPAGLAGLYGLMTGGAAKGASNVEAFREALTYRPRDPSSLQALGRTLQPITDRIDATKQYLGDGAMDRTGSPGLATAAYMIPDAALTLLGARGMGVKGPTMTQMAQRSAMPTSGSPAAQLGIFAGKGAKTADLNAMAVARAQLDQGADPRMVWTETGWMQGPDGQMRFEIDDSGSAMRPDAAQQLLQNAGRRQSSVMDHDRLYSAYPEAAHIWTARAGDGGGGYASGEMGVSDMISLGYQRKAPDMGEVHSTNLHEIQHGIQEREGFAQGGSPENASQYSPAFERWAALRGTPEAEAAYRLIPNDYAAYQRLAGEAESRAVEKRLDYTPAQRRAIYPLDDYDVPIDELIIRGKR